MDILLVPNRDKPDAVQAAQQLFKLVAQALQARAPNRGAGAGGRVAVMPGADWTQLAEFRPDLVVVLGGDGSILTTAHALGSMQVPVVGINFGKLGYLAAYSMEEFIAGLEKARRGG